MLVRMLRIVLLGPQGTGKSKIFGTLQSHAERSLIK